MKARSNGEREPIRIQRTVRLTRTDRANLAVIVQHGYAKDGSGAIRVALALARRFIERRDTAKAVTT